MEKNISTIWKGKVNKIKLSIPTENGSMPLRKKTFTPWVDFPEIGRSVSINEVIRFSPDLHISLLQDTAHFELAKQMLKSAPYFPIFYRLTELTKKLEENYESYRKRQVLFFQIKEHIHELWKSTDDDLRKLALRLESYVNVTKSENLKRKHVEALKSIFSILITKGEMGIPEAKQIMIDEKMRTLPKIKGLTNLYKS